MVEIPLVANLQTLKNICWVRHALNFIAPSLIRTTAIAGISGAIILAAGCSTQVGSPDVPGQVAGAQTSQKAQKDRSEISTGSAASPSKPKPASAIIEQIIADAMRAQQQQDWQGAIELAEHGLRLDRIQPRLYLVLAQSYWQLNNAELAKNFARQGLRYVKPHQKYIKLQLLDLAR